ncbi:CheR family methyltransferase [Leptospira sp. 96542]|nr:CheR family methyltransferase [Leptospira sp. 96542]
MFESFQFALKQQSGIFIRKDEKWDLLLAAFGEGGIVSGLQSFGEELTTFWKRVYSVLNISETYFFRDPDQLTSIFSDIIPKISLKFGERLEIWSAGASKGEEVYTLAILCELAKTKDPNFPEYRVLGTDLQESSIQFAKEGVYTNYSVRNELPPGFTDFLVWDKHQIRIRPLGEKIRFVVGNLLEPQSQKFHLVVCRNVLIYLDEDTKEILVSRLLDALLPGGILVLGHSEYLGNLPPNAFAKHTGKTGYIQNRLENQREDIETNSKNPDFGKIPKSGFSKLLGAENPPSRESEKVPEQVAAKQKIREPKKNPDIQDWKAVLYENPESIEAYYNLSNLYWEGGERDLARSYQAKAWSLFKNDPSFSEVLKKRGDWKDVWEEYLIHPL